LTATTKSTRASQSASISHTLNIGLALKLPHLGVQSLL
jgi:hypothetical protein